MRLIDADALNYTKIFASCGNGKYEDVNIVYETDIDAMPTIKPKRGKWIDDENNEYANCSNCGYQIDLHYEQGYLNYCPNCGAKMERSEE